MSLMRSRPATAGQRVCVLIVLLILGGVLGNSGLSAGAAMQSWQASPGPSAAEERVPYCGLYCVFRAAQSLGKRLSFEELLRPEYISSLKGSTGDELIRAARHCGLYCQPLNRLTCSVLRQVSSPVILHVKRSMESKTYDHWVLFMGSEASRARIYDGIQPAAVLPFSELAARWDGRGLILSDAPVQWFSLVWPILSDYLLYSSVAALIVGIILLMQRRIGGREPATAMALAWNGIWQTALVLTVALIVGVGYRAAHAEGFLSDEQAIAAIQNAQVSNFLPKITADQLGQLLGTSHVTIIDSRLASDFDAEHIPRAINLPPDVSTGECDQALAGVPRDERLVVYCQSRGCPFSEIVAKKLISMGYKDILLYPDGWSGWTKYIRTER